MVRKLLWAKERTWTALPLITIYNSSQCFRIHSRASNLAPLLQMGDFQATCKLNQPKTTLKILWLLIQNSIKFNKLKKWKHMKVWGHRYKIQMMNLYKYKKALKTMKIMEEVLFNKACSNLSRLSQEQAPIMNNNCALTTLYVSNLRQETLI